MYMKYIIPFIDKNKWVHNHNCIYCEQIDKQINNILNIQTKDINVALDKINVLENYLVDGYGILQVFEHNGYILLNKDEIDSLYTLKNIDDSVLDKYTAYLSNAEYPDNVSDNITTFYSRWCKHCGARKLDIYDTNRTERFDLLPIKNFTITTKEENNEVYAYINWRDSDTLTYAYTKLFINDEEVLSTNVKNKYEINAYTIKIKPNVMVEIYVGNYDKYNDLLVTSDKKYIVHESNAKSDLTPINDICAWQEVRLIKEDNSYKRKNCIITTYTPTTNNTIVRRAINGIPTNPYFGLECNYIQEVEDSDIRLWYIKPFPVSDRFAKITDGGIKLYYDYNLDSQYTTIQLNPLVDNCTNLSIKNDSKKAYISWEDPNSSNWLKTIIMIKPYDGTPIIHVNDGIIIYNSINYNDYKDKSFIINNLINGKDYQIGIFPVTKDNLVIIDSNQLIAKPRYIRNPYKWHEPYELTYNDHFYWDNDKLTTIQNTVAYLTCNFPFVEGGWLSFQVKSNTAVHLNIYLNEKNVFNQELKANEVYHWKDINIDIPIMEYCKIIFEVKSKYSNMKFSMKNINLYYKEGISS